MRQQEIVRIRIRHRPSVGESAKHRHLISINTLRAGSLTTGKASDSACILEFAAGDELDVGVSDLRPICKRGVKANAVYGHRFSAVLDMAMYDDSLVVTCDTSVVSYRQLISSKIPSISFMCCFEIARIYPGHTHRKPSHTHARWSGWLRMAWIWLRKTVTSRE